MWKVSAIDEGEERGELDIDGETRDNGGRGSGGVVEL